MGMFRQLHDHLTATKSDLPALLFQDSTFVTYRHNSGEVLY